MKRQAGFGNNKENVRNVFDRYIGRWIIIYTPKETSSGRLSSIDGDYLVLNPFQGAEWDKEKGLTRKILNDDSLVERSAIINIEPTTEENLANFANIKIDSML